MFSTRQLRGFTEALSISSQNTGEGDAFVASAIDFLADGSTKVHSSFEHGHPHGSLPYFECPMPPDSIRIVFHDTDDVFWLPPPGTNHYEVGDSVGTVAECEICIPRPEAADNNDGRGSRASLDSSASSHVSPRTKPHTADHQSQKSSSQGDRTSHHSHRDDRANDRNRSRSIDSRHSSHSSHSSRSNALTTDEEEMWKRYRGGYSLDPIGVTHIWERDSGGVRLPIGVNLMFDPDIPAGRTDHDIWARNVGRERHTITFSGVMTSFFTLPNLLWSSWHTEENALLVEMRIFSISSLYTEKAVEQARSPLGEQLWTILCSTKSAMSLYNGNVDMGARLFTFDMLTAVVACWLTFLELVHRKSAWRPRSWDSMEFLERFQLMLGDREHLQDFARSIRDLLQAVDATIEAIEIGQSFNDEQKARYRHVLLSRRTQREVLQSVMKDIEDYVDGQVARAERVTNQRQDASLKRLTLVASIFLPLTTACSLLSMTNRVKDVGAIWWDWLGIVVIIGFLVVTGYRITSGWHNFCHRPAVQWAAQKWRRKWKEAKVEVLAEESKDQPLSGSDPDRLVETALVPTSSRVMFRVAPYIFVAAAVASFFVGMFVKVSTGAEALGYSAAGTVLTAIAAISMWKLARFMVRAGFKALFWLVSCLIPLLCKVRSPGIEQTTTSDNESRSSAQAGSGRSVSEQSQSHEQKQQEMDQRRRGGIIWRMLGFIFRSFFWLFSWSIIGLIKWTSKGLYWMFKVLFGDRILRVLFRMLKKEVGSYVPDSVSWMYRRARDKFNKKSGQSRGANDIENSVEQDGPRSRSSSRNRGRSRSRSHGDGGKEKAIPDSSKDSQGRENKNRPDDGKDQAQDAVIAAPKHAMTWTEREVKRTPTQNSLVKGKKAPRRAATLPRDRRK